MNDTNLLLRHLKPAGRKIGTPWLGWHTLPRTHATQLQMAGGTIKDAQAQYLAISGRRSKIWRKW